jgi:hypothetical protein
MCDLLRLTRLADSRHRARLRTNDWLDLVWSAWYWTAHHPESGYVLFAVMSGSLFAMLVESAVMTAFAALAVLGFKGTLWIVAAALAGHAVFDAVHGSQVTNPGVPVWWPAFCLAYDLTAAGAMTWLLRHRPALAREPWQTGA